MEILTQILFYLFLAFLFALLISFVVSCFYVPFVPVTKKVASRMIQTSCIKKGDVHYDLGSGDGRVMFEAAKQGAQSTGFELLLPLVILTNLKAKLSRINIKAVNKNFFNADVSNANLITMYLIPRLMPRVEKFLENAKLNKGTKIVSYAFKLPNWEPKEIIREGKMGPIWVYEI